MSKKLIKPLTILIYMLPLTALAANATIHPNTSNADVPTYLNSFVTVLLGIAGALAVLFIIYGGLQYITSAGNEKRAEAAKKTLTYAIAGLLVVILAGVAQSVLTGSLKSILGNGSTNF